MENTKSEEKEVLNENEEKIEDCLELYPLDEDDTTIENDACDEEDDEKEKKSAPILNYVIVALLSIILAVNVLVTYDLKNQLEDTQEVLTYYINGNTSYFPYGYDDVDYADEAADIRQQRESYRKRVEESLGAPIETEEDSAGNK